MRNQAITILDSIQATRYFNPLICRLLALAPLSCTARFNTLIFDAAAGLGVAKKSSGFASVGGPAIGVAYGHDTK